eukprot:2526781-Ditylum_brightwellii.AAC.1
MDPKDAAIIALTTKLNTLESSFKVVGGNSNKKIPMEICPNPKDNMEIAPAAETNMAMTRRKAYQNGEICFEETKLSKMERIWYGASTIRKREITMGCITQRLTITQSGRKG